MLEHLFEKKRIPADASKQPRSQVFLQLIVSKDAGHKLFYILPCQTSKSEDVATVLPDDDLDSLLERVHDTEHRIFPKAVRALVEGRLKVKGRVVHVLEEEGEG